MPRPKNKNELLDLSLLHYNKLFELMDSFSQQEKKSHFPFEHRDKNIRDVLVHLHHWHLMMLSWYEVGMRGEKPIMPCVGFTWKTTSDLNKSIWEKYQNINYEESIKLLERSFLEVRALIEKHNDEELFEKRRYAWTGSTSLGSYLTSSSSSHYDWALKLLKKYKRSLK